MADVKWIKITTDIFDDEKILLIESLPDSYAIITVWFKLLCLAGKQNNSGVFMMGRIAFTDKMLATIFRMKETTVTMALQTFEQFGMIEIVDGVITIPNWGKHQSLDQLESKKEYMRNYMAEYRGRQKALALADSSCKTNSKTNSKTNVRQADKDIDKEKELEEDKKKDIRHKYGEYNNVLLSDTDLQKLKDEFPVDYEERINNLSAYMASTGKSYKNHLATIRNWARKDKAAPAKQEQKNSSFETDDFFASAVKRSYKKKLSPREALEREVANGMETREKARTAGEDPEIARRAAEIREKLKVGEN